MIMQAALVLRRLLRQPPSLLRVVALLIALLAYGTTGFLYFEVGGRPELAWADGLWWTLVTLTTVGYGDLFPTTDGGRFLVAVPVMVLGISLLGYVLSIAATSLVDERTKEATGMAKIDLDGHLVIMNFPSLAKIERLLEEVASSAVLGPELDVVIVDEDLPQLPIELTRRDRVRFVRGNPARDETLGRAGIERASRAFVLSKRPGDPHSDDLAIAIVLAIETRQAKIHTVVECVDATSAEILKKAGADAVVCTSRFDAHFLGAEMAMPGAQDVIDQILSTQRGPQMLFVPAAGFTTFGAAATGLRSRGHLAVGVRRNRKIEIAPSDDRALGSQDEVVVLASDAARLLGT